MTLTRLFPRNVNFYSPLLSDVALFHLSVFWLLPCWYYLIHIQKCGFMWY